MLYIVGVGPGDPELITLKALKALERCERVAGWRSVLLRLGLSEEKAVELTYRNQEERLRELAELSASRDVCIAVHGDPTVSDWELLDRVRELGVPFEVINGVSSLNLALARAGLDMAHVVFITQHARSPQSLSDAALPGRSLVVFPPLDAKGRSELWEELKRFSQCKILLMERLSLPGERVVELKEREQLLNASDLSAVVVKC